MKCTRQGRLIMEKPGMDHATGFHKEHTAAVVTTDLRNLAGEHR